MKRALTTIFIFLLAILFAEADSAPCKKIVCLSPSGAEILFAIGAGEKIAARTDFCDYPAEIKKIESIGGFDGKTLSVEKIIATGCDFVLGSRGMHDFLEKPLEKFGIKLHLENANSLDSILDEIEFLGKITGNEKEAENVVKNIKEKIMTLRKSSRNFGPSTSSGTSLRLQRPVAEPVEAPKIYFEIWNQPLMSAGKSSYINETIEIAGGKNIFENIETDYPIVSAETILKSNPEIIILQSDSTETLETLKRRPAWKKISAIKNGNVVKVDSALFSRPGPRIVEAVEILKKIIEDEK